MSLRESWKVQKAQSDLSTDEDVSSTSSSIPMAAAAAYSKEFGSSLHQSNVQSSETSIAFSVEDIYKRKEHGTAPVELLTTVKVVADTKDSSTDYEQAKRVMDKLLDSKKELVLPNGLKLTKTSETTIDIELINHKIQIDLAKHTIKPINPTDKRSYSTITLDADGNIVVPWSDKEGTGSETIRKDGSVVTKYNSKELAGFSIALERRTDGTTFELDADGKPIIPKRDPWAKYLQGVISYSKEDTDREWLFKPRQFEPK